MGVAGRIMNIVMDQIIPPFPTFSTSKLTLQTAQVPSIFGLGTRVTRGVSHVLSIQGKDFLKCVP